MQSVKLTVNGRGQVYEYDKRFTNLSESGGDGYEIGVKFGNRYGNMRYTRPIYKADAEFTSADKDRELKVYLTYRIGIKNNSSNVQARVNQIVDYYDSRYETDSIIVGRSIDTNANITNQISFTKENYNNEYNKLLIQTEELGLIKGISGVTENEGNSKEIYVQFKLSREAVVEIMNSKETLDNVTEITSYSIFDKNGGSVYAGIDRNSNPGNAVPGSKDTYEDDTDWAPSIQLETKVPDAGRKISGNVFEDKAIADKLTKENIRQGNGIFDTTTEPGIQNVKVELLRKEAKADGTYGDWTVKDEYTTTTDSNGSYTISDFAAGDYVIRYTWGDDEYTVQNYKATIFDDSKHQGTKWYQDISERPSDATDDYSIREAIDNELKEIKHNTGTTIEKMVSETPEMAIDVEYNPTEVYNPNPNPGQERPSEGETGENTYGVNREHKIQYLDFGIIERPRQNYELLKKINHVKVTLSNGQVLIDADIDENYNVIPKKHQVLHHLDQLELELQDMQTET